jgi:hypothetical protein
MPAADRHAELARAIRRLSFWVSLISISASSSLRDRTGSSRARAAMSSK